MKTSELGRGCVANVKAMRWTDFHTDLMPRSRDFSLGII